MADRTSTVRVIIDSVTEGAAGKLGTFGKVAGAAALGVGALAVGGVLAANKLYDMGDALDDSNSRIRNITKQMGLFGDQAGSVADRLIKLAETTALQTGLDANSIKATQAKLLTFKALAATADQVGGNFDRATQAAIDLAAAGFGTAETNATQLGKALQDPVKGLTSLSRAGVTFTDQEKARIATLVESNKMGQAQQLVLKAIESQVGGTAQALSGGFERMKESFRQGGQALALKLQPYLDRFGNWVVDKGAPAARKIAAELAEKVVPALRKTADFIRAKVIPAAQEFETWFIKKIVPGIQKYLTPILAGAEKGFAKVEAAVKRNRPQLEELFNGFKKLVEFMAEHVAPIVGKFAGFQLNNLGTAIGVAIDIIGGLVTAFNAVRDAVSAVVGFIKDVSDAIRNIPSLPDLHIPNPFGRTSAGSGGFGAGGPGISKVPSGGNVININVTGAVDPHSTARQIEQLLRRRGVFLGGAAG